MGLEIVVHLGLPVHLDDLALMLPLGFGGLLLLDQFLEDEVTELILEHPEEVRALVRLLLREVQFEHHVLDLLA